MGTTAWVCAQGRILASTASEHWPPITRGGAAGLFVRPVSAWVRPRAYVVLSLVSVTMPAVFRDVSYAVDGYSRLVEPTARVITGRAVQVAWLSAVASLSLSASLVLRARLAVRPFSVRLKPDTTHG